MSSRILLSALVAAAPAWAQDLPPVLITGNPLQSADPASPSSVLAGDALALRRASTLGETLDGLPGVSASAFGPNASRPVIRGQDGDRIRVLSNAGASFDASGLSYDHAVPLDPLVVERLEVLRGPAALLYGGGAMGGVVNAIDHRIPRSALAAPSGAMELRLGGAARERAVSGLVEGGADGLAWHADGFGRRTGDLAVPRFERPLADGGSERRDRVLNSASEAAGGAVGASRVWADGYLGVSADTYRNHYGVVVEDDITIRMRRDKLALAGEARALSGPWHTVRGQVSATDYEHREIEGDGSVGTVFATRGGEARLEALHRPLALAGGLLDGVAGLQLEASRFSALGEEAFVPTTRSEQAAVFAMERLSLGRALELSAGARAETVRVRSAGDADGSEPRFGDAQSRRFQPVSASLASTWRLAPAWQASVSAAYTERAPTSYELYANGLHAATGTVERGDVQQALERGRNLDLGLAWQQGGSRLKLSVFESRFSNYIALLDTGETVVDDEGSARSVYAFAGVPARLRGVEFEGQWPLLAREGQHLSAEFKADWLRGERRDKGEPLPRLSPLRGSVALHWQVGPWGLGGEVQAAARQDRVAPGDTPTPGWVQAHLSAQWSGTLAGQEALCFVKLRNLGDTLAYQASSIATVRTLSPQAGRSLAVGLRLGF